MISRVNMVIVGAHAVMANGGVIAPVGLNMAALAAQRHAVPFVVLAGSHKLCPLYSHNPEVLLNELRSPSELLDFGEFSDCMDFRSGTGSPLLHVVILHLILCHQSLVVYLSPTRSHVVEGIIYHTCTSSSQITTLLMIWWSNEDLLQGVEFRSCF